MVTKDESQGKKKIRLVLTLAVTAIVAMSAAGTIYVILNSSSKIKKNDRITTIRLDLLC
jgi:flagellar basal body-associated protein FliL